MFKYGYESFVKNKCEFSHTEEDKNGVVRDVYYDPNTGRRYTLNAGLTVEKKADIASMAFFPTKEQREKRRKMLEEQKNKEAERERDWINEDIDFDEYDEFYDDNY